MYDASQWHIGVSHEKREGFGVVGFGWRRGVAQCVAVFAAVALLAADTQPSVAQPAREPGVVEAVGDGVDQPLDPGVGREDPVAAQITAFATGERVEDLSARTVTERLFANPDGTWTLEAFTGAMGDDSDIEEPDPDAAEPEAPSTPLLADGDGKSLSGVVSALEINDGEDSLGEGPTSDSVALVRLESTAGEIGTPAGDDTDPGVDAVEGAVDASGAGTDPGQVPDADAGGVSGDSAEMVLGFEGELGAPQVVENEAVYPDAQVLVGESSSLPVQVVVDAVGEGFSHRVVLDEDPGQDLVLRFPIGLSEGLRLVQDEETSALRVLDAEGGLVFFGSAPVMWDSTVVDEQVGVRDEVPVVSSVVVEDGTPVLVLDVDQDWLSAAERVFPVTIDPVWTAHVDADTWVQSGTTAPQVNSVELRAGTFNSGTNRARSYLKFDFSGVAGADVVRAELKLWNHHSWSCSPAGLTAARVTGAQEMSRFFDVTTGRQYRTPTLKSNKGYRGCCSNFERKVNGSWINVHVGIKR
ncbi:MAG: DNRLRE domain-containing protein [Micrococcus sp.]|nr:DNRLRE domain-containing protein [Micrococcus sp.]